MAINYLQNTTGGYILRADGGRIIISVTDPGDDVGQTRFSNELRTVD